LADANDCRGVPVSGGAVQAAAQGLARLFEPPCEEGIGSVTLVPAGEAASQHVARMTLFMEADIVVKVVMVGLLLASIWTWAIIVAQWWKMRRVARENERFEREFWKSEDIDRFYDTRGRRIFLRPRCWPPASPNGAAPPPARRWTGRERAHGWRWR
jgi:hypothetical protein